jgi:hypothetical protein
MEKPIFMGLKTFFEKWFETLNKSIFMLLNYGNAEMYML